MGNRLFGIRNREITSTKLMSTQRNLCQQDEVAPTAPLPTDLRFIHLFSYAEYFRAIFNFEKYSVPLHRTVIQVHEYFCYLFNSHQWFISFKSLNFAVHVFKNIFNKTWYVFIRHLRTDCFNLNDCSGPISNSRF